MVSTSPSALTLTMRLIKTLECRPFPALCPAPTVPHPAAFYALTMYAEYDHVLS